MIDYLHYFNVGVPKGLYDGGVSQLEILEDLLHNVEHMEETYKNLNSSNNELNGKYNEYLKELKLLKERIEEFKNYRDIPDKCITLEKLSQDVFSAIENKINKGIESYNFLNGVEIQNGKLVIYKGSSKIDFEISEDGKLKIINTI